jgi:hypothetical protein
MPYSLSTHLDARAGLLLLLCHWCAHMFMWVQVPELKIYLIHPATGSDSVVPGQLHQSHLETYQKGKLLGPTSLLLLWGGLSGF